MSNRSLLGALILGLGLGSFALLQPSSLTAKDGDAKPAGNVQRIEDLIKQLGSAKFQERDAASKELEAIGAPAIEALKKAVKTEDLETSKRAGELVRRLEDRAFTASLLAPKRVRLKVTDMPALEAVSELAKISGYPIQVHGDRTKLADKKVTLDTGEVAFWDALDQLCLKAGLVEQPFPGATNPGFRVDPPRLIGPPVQIQPIAPRIQPRPIEKAPVDNIPIEKAPVEKPIRKVLPQGVIEEVKVEVVAQAQVQPAQVQIQAQPVQVAQPIQVQAQPVQIQIQLQPGQAQPIQIQPFPVPPFPGGNPGVNPGQIILIPGTPQKDFTSYAGSVRVRMLPNAQPISKGEYMVQLDVAAEPRLQGFSVVGTPNIEKAIDDQGQKLTPLMVPGPANPQPNPFGPAGIRNLPAMDIMAPGGFMTGQRRATVRIKGGEKEAKTLKELSGTVTAQVVGPAETLLSLENVLKAAGQTAKGKDGGFLQLTSIEKMANGDYKAQIQLVSPQGQNPFGAVFGNGVIQMQQVQIQVGGFGGGGIAGPGNTAGLPDLVDAKGNKFQVVQIPNRRTNFNNGQGSQDLTIVFRGGKDQGEPDRLVVNGTRQVTLTIPFSFQNVPLSMLGVQNNAPAGVAPGVVPGVAPVDLPVPLPPVQRQR